jgi:hypothetical protein
LRSLRAWPLARRSGERYVSYPLRLKTRGRKVGVLDGLMPLFHSGRGFLKGSRWQGSFPLAPGSVARCEVRRLEKVLHVPGDCSLSFPDPGRSRGWVRVASWGGWWKKYPREVRDHSNTRSVHRDVEASCSNLDAPDAWLPAPTGESLN